MVLTTACLQNTNPILDLKQNKFRHQSSISYQSSANALIHNGRRTDVLILDFKLKLRLTNKHQQLFQMSNNERSLRQPTSAATSGPFSVSPGQPPDLLLALPQPEPDGHAGEVLDDPLQDPLLRVLLALILKRFVNRQLDDWIRD